MLKNLMIAILVSAFSVTSWGTVADRLTSEKDNDTNNWVPFPWAQELPFTWSTAQGVWTVGTAGAVTSYFYIRVSRDKYNKTGRFLTITEKEAATCTTVATGFGTEEGDKRIVAQMKYVDTTLQRYSMVLRIFDPKALPESQDVRPTNGKVMVLTIVPQSTTKKYYYPMVKVSDRTEYPCTPVK
jgi:hypothetical protein